MNRWLVGLLWLTACGGDYPQLPEAVDGVPVASEPSVRALDLLRPRDPEASVRSVEGVWDSTTSASSRGTVAQRGHEEGVLGYRLLQIRAADITLDERPVVPILHGTLPPAATRGYRVPALYDQLTVWKSAADKAAEEGIRPPFDGVLMVEAVPTTTSDVLMPVVFTAGLVGFTHVQLLGERPADAHLHPDDALIASVALALPMPQVDLPDEAYVTVCASGARIGERQPAHPVTLAVGSQVGMPALIEHAVQYSQEGPVTLVGLGTDPCAPRQPSRPPRPATLYREATP